MKIQQAILSIGVALFATATHAQTHSIDWFKVAGGGGTQAMTVLRARVTAGNPPTAVQLMGFDLQDWAKEGALADLNELAREERWDEVIPPALQRFAKYDGKWMIVNVIWQSPPPK